MRCGLGALAINLSLPVLVVDDYPTMISIVRKQLNRFGFGNVFDAADGSQALAMMHTQDIGLVISDWNMHPMSGYQLLLEVRADEKLKTTPFLLVTAESKPEKFTAAQIAGADAYIVKPFNAATLKSKLEKVLGKFAEPPVEYEPLSFLR